MKIKRQMILAKIETTYNTDPVPTAAANWIPVENIQINPVEMDTDDQMTVSSSFGQDEKIVAAIWSTVSFDVPLVGGNTAGGPPTFDPVLRACGMAKVVSAGVSVTYTPIDTGEESMTIYFFLDLVKQPITGIKGSFELKFNAKKKPVISFKGIGLRNPMVDASIPTPTLPTMPRPRAVNKANTTVTFGSLNAFLSSLTIDQNNDIQYRNLTGKEEVIMTDRNSKGSVSIELPTVAAKNFLGTGGVMSDALTDTLTVVHGTAAGNICTLNLAAAQMFKPKLSDEQGQAMLQGEMHLVRNQMSLVFT
jgi:hypothetical protein